MSIGSTLGSRPGNPRRFPSRAALGADPCSVRAPACILGNCHGRGSDCTSTAGVSGIPSRADRSVRVECLDISVSIAKLEARDHVLPLHASDTELGAHITYLFVFHVNGHHPPTPPPPPPPGGMSRGIDRRCDSNWTHVSSLRSFIMTVGRNWWSHITCRPIYGMLLI